MTVVRTLKKALKASAGVADVVSGRKHARKHAKISRHKDWGIKLLDVAGEVVLERLLRRRG